MTENRQNLPFQGSSTRPFLTRISPIRYGVAAIIVLTVVYAVGHIVPMIRNDLALMRKVSVSDVRGINLEEQLRDQIEASRARFLNILLEKSPSAQRQLATQLLHQSDSAVLETQSQINSLGVLPPAAQQQFIQKWQQYQSLQDSQLAGLSQSAPADPAQIYASLNQALVPIEQSIRENEAAFEASSSARILEASHALSGALKEMLVLIVLKVGMLALLLWLDWRRLRAERQLEAASRELRATQDRFRQAYESAAVGMGMFKLDGTVLSTNQKAAQILGYEAKQLIGMKVSDIMAPEFKDDHTSRISTLPESSEDSYQVERRIIRKDGTTAWVRNSVTLLKPVGAESHYFSISEEITRQKEANDRLEYLANYDPITNLPNRRYFEEQLTSAMAQALARNECLALLYLEIDSFDFLKGTFGRNVADEVLAELGASLYAFKEEGEIVARLDDQVFAMLVNAPQPDEVGLMRGNQLRDLFHHSSESGKHRIPLSASIGVAISGNRAAATSKVRPIRSTTSQVPKGAPHEPDNDADSLLKFARAAMLEARARGGDAIFLADPALQERAAERHAIEMALLQGLRENEFRVVFQPQFEIATGRLVRFEALCRWTSAQLGPIGPDRFIPIAEQTGVIMEIGRRVLIDSLRHASQWTKSGRNIGVAVNISPMQFMRPDFIATVTEALAISKFPADLLELEITEGIFIRDLNVAVARIQELQKLGLSVALDDFGTGFSSLSYLRRMPIDAVKLDRSFVSDLTTDAATVSMVRSVLAMARALNLRVVTEGVETEDQLDILRTLGCDEAQGYLMGRPESADQALDRVLNSPLPSIITVA